MGFIGVFRLWRRDLAAFSFVFVSEFGAEPVTRYLIPLTSVMGSGLIGGGVVRLLEHALRQKISPFLSDDWLEMRGRKIPLSAICRAQKNFETLRIWWKNGRQTRCCALDLRFLKKPNEFLEELEKRGVKLS